MPPVPHYEPGREREKFVHVPALLNDLFGMSLSEARRAIAQNGVRANGRVVVGLDVPADEVEGREITVGKRAAQASDDLPARRMYQP